MRAEDGWDRQSIWRVHLWKQPVIGIFLSLFSDKTFTFFNFILTFGSSWSFTTLAARAIGLVAAACKQQQLGKNPGKKVLELINQFGFLLPLCWCTMISRSLGERMRTKMMRTRMRMITTRKNMMRQKIRTVVEEGCCVSVLQVMGWRAFLIVFMDKNFEFFHGHRTRAFFSRIILSVFIEEEKVQEGRSESQVMGGLRHFEALIFALQQQ